jgi:hypothetical protein
MKDIKDIVIEMEALIGSNLKYYVSESLEDIINKNKNNFSILYPSEIEFSIDYNENQFRLDILTRYSEREYIDLYYKKRDIEEERKIIYYKDGKPNKEIDIKGADISPDKYIIHIVEYSEIPIYDKNGKRICANIKEKHKYVDVSSFEDIIGGIEKILHKYNVSSLKIYNYRIRDLYLLRLVKFFRPSGLR